LNESRIRTLLGRAVRLAARGHGGAEPNPMVGCVIVDARGEVISEGFHRRCGGPHAEVDALAAAGERACGATAIVTLEPCAHRGRTGPCTDALRAAGIARVLYAVADPNPLAAGGGAQLSAAGIQAELFPHDGARELVLPFVKRVQTGLPWISAKWAQSIDGAIALANGDSKWLSCARSRRMVHRERGRVDAILTGIGTVIADDPQLTARGVRVHRHAMRVVFDPALRTPPEAKVCDASAPTVILASESLDAAATQRANQLVARGVRILRLGAGDTMRAPLATLAKEGVARVLVEAGGGVVGRLLREEILDEAWVFVAPFVIGDDLARRSVRGLTPAVLAAVARARLMSVRQRGTDALLHYRWTR
jgi:diaminohydroxyphosphoribosylaminopyrimidine deaminase/5-amino-6-(5-phosphoribosylamino)uracil reductase